MNLSQRLRKIRKDKDLSQKEFADILGTTSQRISELERGKLKNLKPEEISRLKEEYNIDTLWITTGEGKYKNAENGTIVGVVNGDMIINTSNFDHPEDIKELIELLKFAPSPLLDSFKEKLLKIKDITEDK